MFEVFTVTLTNFLAKIIFPEGIGGVQKSRNSRGVREGGGGWWCYFSDAHISWKAHILDTLRNKDHL